MWSLVVDIWGWLQGRFGELIGGIIAGAVVTLTVVFAGIVRRAIYYFWRIHKAKADVACSEPQKEGPGVWVAKPLNKPRQYREVLFSFSKVLIIANLKGGVGKTTLSANLGAYLAGKIKKPVLLIDLDFQGTLSAMACPNDWLPHPTGYSSWANRLVSGGLSPFDIASIKLHAQNHLRLRLIPSYYDLAQAENRVMIEWLLSNRKCDIRYRLADLLNSDHVLETYGAIIIDAAPRLTTASVQALCAASHLLIPTILDKPSIDPVLGFVRQVEQLKSASVCPHLRHLGVVASMVDAREQFSSQLFDLNHKLQRIRNADGEIVTRLLGGDAIGAIDDRDNKRRFLDKRLYLPRASVFRHAGEQGIVYPLTNPADAPNVNECIEALGRHVAREMNLEINGAL